MMSDIPTLFDIFGASLHIMAGCYASTNIYIFENTIYILEYVLYHSLMWNRSLYDTIYSSMDSLKVSICRLHCAEYYVQGTVDILLWKEISVKCTEQHKFYNVHYTLFSIHCTVCTV